MKKLMLAVCSVSVAASAALAEPPREAAVILKEYADVKEPVGDGTRVGDRAYFQSYFAELIKSQDKKAALALELFEAHPEHPQTIPLMLKRWSHLASGGKGDKVRDEVAAYLKDYPDTKHKPDLFYHVAVAEFNDGDMKKIMAAIDEFIRVAPKDARGGDLLGYAAGNVEDAAEQLKLYRRIVADYPDSKGAASAAGGIRQAEGIGKPFELTFEDAITGKPVSMKALQGKVVVIDFWATWCGPCVAEMPTMKKLYAEHKDHGVEFVGISLDQPGEGLDTLKKLVQEKDIPWPQYYQGNGWESKFSMSWGINSIPALFVIDSDGNLHSTNARGKLETMIPELIKKRDDKKVTCSATTGVSLDDDVRSLYRQPRSAMLRPGPRNQTSEVVRFVLWLTVVALAVAWWIDRSEGESRAVRIQQRADAAVAKAEKRLFELELLAGDEERFRQLKELKAKLAAEDLVAKRAAERKGSD